MIWEETEHKSECKCVLKLPLKFGNTLRIKVIRQEFLRGDHPEADKNSDIIECV